MPISRLDRQSAMESTMPAKGLPLASVGIAKAESAPSSALAPAATPPSAPQAIQAPSIALPKGGGAIRGIGEKFSTNPITGTASLSVPIFTSSGRTDFDPQLSLSYDSGAGNGPFGFGWSLALPSITRKTDKGLPRYRDGHGDGDDKDSDVFLLSGASEPTSR